MSKNDDEVLVRVDGVSKKFCRSLKKSLWYGVCDIASELNPFGRSTGQSYADKNLTTIERHGGRENRRLGKAEEDQLKVAPQRGAASGTMQVKEQLEVGPKGEGVGRTESKETANDASGSGEQTGSDSESAKFDSLDPSHLALRADLRSLHLAPAPALDCGKKSSSELDSGPSTLDSTHGLRAGEFFAVKDVSFELRRGELRTLGRSEKEISKKCLGATKGPDSGRSRHQCLGLIGHNGAGNQAAGQPFGRLPQAARRVRRRGKARINMTLLKMLNGLIKPDAGSITMRGRVGALIALMES